MNGQIRLSPFGTVRSLVDAEGPAVSGPEDLSEFFTHLMSRMGIFNLEEEIVHIPYELVRWQDGLSDLERKSLILLGLVTLINLEQGSTRLPLDTTEGRDYITSVLRIILDTEGSESGPAWLPGTAESVMESIMGILSSRRASLFIGTPGEYKPLIYEAPYLYHQKMLHLEERFAISLRRLMDRKAPTHDPATFEDHLRALENKPFRLSDDQRKAVCTAISSPFSIISGGPGTGKTSVIVSLLRMLVRLGIKPEAIALAAPTGKAANRMGEAIQKTIRDDDETDRMVKLISAPRTLHRLLGYAPSTGRFAHHENNRLSEQVVIVDESSMIHLFLMERLIRSVREEGQLVLIGDADQLPSVEAGAVFRDLTADFLQEKLGGLLHVIKLTMNFRMREDDPFGRNILAVARTIQEGNAAPIFDELEEERIVIRKNVKNVLYEKVEMIEPRGEEGTLEEFLSDWYSSRYKVLEGLEKLIRKEYRYGEEGFRGKDLQDLELLFDHFNKFKILCLTRGYDTGTEAINRYFHGRILEDSGMELAPQFVPGESVMMHHNDYTRNITTVRLITE